MCVPTDEAERQKQKGDTGGHNLLVFKLTATATSKKEK